MYCHGAENVGYCSVRVAIDLRRDMPHAELVCSPQRRRGRRENAEEI